MVLRHDALHPHLSVVGTSRTVPGDRLTLTAAPQYMHVFDRLNGRRLDIYVTQSVALAGLSERYATISLEKLREPPCSTRRTFT